MSDWQRVWSEVSLRHIEAKDSQGVIVELFKLYAELDPAARKVVNQDLFAAMHGSDETYRYDALAIANKFKLIDALPHLLELASQLQLDDSPGAPYELAKVQRIIQKLSTTT